MTSASAFVVYLVDDDTGVLKALTRVLNGKGYEVLAFSSPTEFLAQHDPSIPGCAIFDVSMPGLDGLELQAALKAGGVERPVIFITGVGDIPATVRAMKAGAIDFLTKPVRSQELLAAVLPAQGDFLGLDRDRHHLFQRYFGRCLRLRGRQETRSAGSRQRRGEEESACSLVGSRFWKAWHQSHFRFCRTTENQTHRSLLM